MFGNSYTAVVVQVNGERIAKEVWTRLGDMTCVTEFERMRVSYHDLSVMVLQSDGETATKYKDVLFKMIRDNYGRLVDNHSVFIEVCPDIEKNTFSRGKVFEEEVDSLECVRLSLVFHGFSDILPFLTIFNAAVRSPPTNAPVPLSTGVPYPRASGSSNQVPRPVPQAMPRPIPRPMPRPMPQSGTRPVLQPGTRPMPQPMGRPTQSGARPIPPPGFRPPSQPNVRPTARPMPRIPMQPRSPSPRNPQPSPRDYPRGGYMPRPLPPQPSFPNNPHPNMYPNPRQ